MADKKKTSSPVHLVSGGIAGLCEALACHPLDTIKVRMQLSTRARLPGAKKRSFFGVGRDIVRKESPLALYKGLGAVVTGIVPKMAIRFSSFEAYKRLLADEQGKVATGKVFIAGLGAGVTEAVAVVSPMECIKIRLQAQHHSMADPLDVPRYRNAAHAAYTIVREEGLLALYRGVSLTALRQATNQGVNFTAYQEFQKWAKEWQEIAVLPSYQNFLLGGISGAMGPMSNAPIDTIKTRIQRGASTDGSKGLARIVNVTRDLVAKEGVSALYKGITPRVLRVAPGQAVTFAVYEKIKGWLEGGMMDRDFSQMAAATADKAKEIASK
ncbi:Mitochondrial succinate-fumarate transporter [Savitreella phatthalungensis]